MFLEKKSLFKNILMPYNFFYRKSQKTVLYTFDFL